jgi:hypothetical protein
MSLSLDGLVSGLKTTEVIKALMDVAAIPRSLLKAKMDDKNGVVTQLRTLNTAVQNLATAAEKAATRDGLARFTTTSSSPTVHRRHPAPAPRRSPPTSSSTRSPRTTPSSPPSPPAGPQTLP